MVNFDTAIASLYRAMGTGLSMKGIEFWEGGEPRTLDLDLPR